MSLIVDSRVGFIHLQKCAGSWVRQVVRNAGLETQEIGDRHGSAAALRELHPRLYIFATVRHPREWLRSVWCYGMRKIESGERGVAPFWRGRIPFHHEFSEFVRSYLAICPGYISTWFAQQTDGADQVLHSESIAGQLQSVFHQAGVVTGSRFSKIVRTTPPAKICGQLDSWKKRSAYSRELETRLLSVEKEMLTRFGYA